MLVKDVQIYLYGLKMTCLDVLERGERGDDNETGLKEGGGIEMSNYSASITRCTLLRLNCTYPYKLDRDRLCLDLPKLEK